MGCLGVVVMRKVEFGAKMDYYKISSEGEMYISVTYDEGTIQWNLNFVV